MAPYALALLRAVSGFMLTLHGLSMMFGLFSTPDHPAKSATAFTLIWFAAILQLVGGPMLVLGIFTRVVAFILSGHLAVAYFLAHAPHGFWPIMNGGELAALYAFVFLYISSAGGGAFTMESLWAKPRYFEPVGKARHATY